MTTKDLTERESTALARPEDLDVGLAGDYDSSDVVTPTCAMVQPTSASERGKAGQFYFSDGRSVDSFQAVVLNIYFTRALWGPQGSDYGGPVCRSPDRRMGMTVWPSIVTGKPQEDGEMVYIPCAECPHANDDKFGMGDGLCKPGETLLMADAETAAPFLFFVKGTALREVTRVIVSPAIMRRNRGEAAAPWRYVLDFSTRLIENDKGKFYVPEISVVATCNDEQAAQWAEMAAASESRAEQQATQAVVEQAGQ